MTKIRCGKEAFQAVTSAADIDWPQPPGARCTSASTGTGTGTGTGGSSKCMCSKTRKWRSSVSTSGPSTQLCKLSGSGLGLPSNRKARKISFGGGN